MADVFSVEGDSEWRGLGLIAESGVRLTPAYRASTPKRISPAAAAGLRRSPRPLRRRAHR
jgi:hydrogenase maturation factor